MPASRAYQNHAYETLPEVAATTARTKAPAARKSFPRKKAKKSHAKLFLYIIAAFAIGFLVVSRYVAVEESGRELRAARNELTEIESRNEHLQRQIDRGIDLSEVERIAIEEFGMRRLERHQMFYININSNNFGEKIDGNTQSDRDGILQGVPGILINAIETLR